MFDLKPLLTDHGNPVDRNVVFPADCGYHTYRGCLADHDLPTYRVYLPTTVALTTALSTANRSLPHLPRLIYRPQFLHFRG